MWDLAPDKDAHAHNRHHHPSRSASRGDRHCLSPPARRPRLRNGNDELLGGNNRDLAIGGSGDDRIDGGNGEDILIAGLTSFDAFSAAAVQALFAIQSEWLRTDQNYEQRVNHLSGTAPGGLNGTFLLRATGPGRTVFDDLDTDATPNDQLFGGNGRDWYFANVLGSGVLDDLFGLADPELVQDL